MLVKLVNVSSSCTIDIIAEYQPQRYYFFCICYFSNVRVQRIFEYFEERIPMPAFSLLRTDNTL